MTSTLDRLVLFEPELAPRSRPLSRHGVPGWPTLAPADCALDLTTWLTRAARGLSWHRSGRARPRRTSDAVSGPRPNA
jgi:hypothetical protein